MFDYKLLQALAVVLQEGGFDKAARTLHLTQSAVSQRLKQLEDQCGQILLARTTPPQPTPAGRILLKHYLQVCRLEDEVQGKIGGKGQDVVTLAIGINADSLATWFGECIPAFVHRESILFDLRVDDQDQTHQLLKNGEVMGCISTQASAMQGCTVSPLGCMPYRIFASPEFARRWFANGGLTAEACRRAPFILFNRKDTVHHHLFHKVLGHLPQPLPCHYLPSSEKFIDFIASGMGYGMLPDQQSRLLMAQGDILDLAPDHFVPVHLYWHCWNIGSTTLKKLTQYLFQEAGTRLLPYTEKKSPLTLGQGGFSDCTADHPETGENNDQIIGFIALM